MEKTLNIKVLSIDDKEVVCHVVETNQNKIFQKHLFCEDAEVGDELKIVTKVVGSTFFMEFFPKEEKLSRILIEKVNHKGQELDCYVPQIKLSGKWHNILKKGSYILKDSFEPVMLCKVCHGDGCKECRNGFRKGISIDLKHVAKSLIENELKKLNQANDIIKNYVK